jgi:hypothetical protein
LVRNKCVGFPVVEQRQIFLMLVSEPQPLKMNATYPQPLEEKTNLIELLKLVVFF